MITGTMNQKNKMEIQGVVYQVKFVDCNSIYIGETGWKLIARLEKHKQDGNTNDGSNIFEL